MITIPCPTCDGHGRAPLPRELADTLALFTDRAGMTAQQCHDIEPIGTRSAYNGRLNELMRLGLVVRRKEGRTFVYTLPRNAKRK